MKKNADSLIQAFNERAKTMGLLPVKAPPCYEKLVDEEIEATGCVGGPLYRAVYPLEDQLDVTMEHEVPDFVEDRTNMPGGLENTLIHKYRGRALFLATDQCAGRCMYCFRKDVLAGLRSRSWPDFQKRLDLLVDYLNQHPHVSELILSGGDPMSLPFRHLEQTLKRIGSETGVSHIRAHTRNVVFAPGIFSERLCQLLGRRRVRVYLHIVHPYELTDDVRHAIAMLRSHGARTYGQFPILRGINDHSAVLERLLIELDDLGVNVVDMFVPDPVKYSASFRIPMKRLIALMDTLYWTTSSWINGVRMTLDTPIGKVRREDISSWDEERNIITFQREGKEVVYHDFPAEFDTPGNIDTLLWKG